MQARRTRFKPRSKLETRKVYVEAHADKTKLETLVLGLTESLQDWKTESGGRIQALETNKWHLANKNFQLGDKCSRLEGDCSRLLGRLQIMERSNALLTNIRNRFLCLADLAIEIATLISPLSCFPPSSLIFSQRTNHHHASCLFRIPNAFDSGCTSG